MSETVRNKNPASLPRAILGLVAGAIVWAFGVLILARILIMLWPAYAVPARLWVQSNTYAFSTPMSVCNAGFWIAVEIAAGWITTVIARRQGPVRVLAALVMAYLCFLHLYYMWPKFPWWYNLVVALSSGPAVLFGGGLGTTLRRGAAPVAAAAT